MSVNEKMTAIADAIRDKTGGTEKLGLDAMASGVGEVYDKGVTDGHEKGYETAESDISVELDSIIAAQEEMIGDIFITFTFAGREYTAVDGMTWEEWCNSWYNTDNLVYIHYYDSGEKSLKTIAGYDVHGPNLSQQWPNTVIIADTAYVGWIG